MGIDMYCKLISLILASRFVTSEGTTVDAAFFAALAADEDLGRTRGIDATLKQFNLDAILLPTDGNVSVHHCLSCQTVLFISPPSHSGFTSGPAAIAGYPIGKSVLQSYLIQPHNCSFSHRAPGLPA